VRALTREWRSAGEKSRSTATDHLKGGSETEWGEGVQHSVQVADEKGEGAGLDRRAMPLPAVARS
jgi:hypothetical protein